MYGKHVANYYLAFIRDISEMGSTFDVAAP